MGGFKWSAEDVAFLAKNYGVMPIEEIAEELVRTPAAIHRKAHDEKIRDGRNRPWKLKEVRFLEENADKMMAKEIAVRINRTTSSVLAKGAYLGIQFTSCRQHHSDEDVALVLGLHREKVPVKEIALKMEMSVHTVRSFLYRFGRDRQLTPAQ